MFSKAKRFEPIVAPKSNGPKKPDIEVPTTSTKVKAAPSTSQPTPSKTIPDNLSQCGSVRSVKSFVTPKPARAPIKAPSSLNKVPCSATNKPKLKPQLKAKTETKAQELVKSQQVEIRNKDYTISEYNKQIEELKNEIAALKKKIKDETAKRLSLDEKLSLMKLDDDTKTKDHEISKESKDTKDYDNFIKELKDKIDVLEQQCESLEQEVSSKQVELTSLEGVITIRDSLCRDLQDKLSSMETTLQETQQRLEMVKGHHALALEANESIRREYKGELETLKHKMEEEKQSITQKSKLDHDNVKAKYVLLIDEMKNNLTKEKEEIVYEMQQQLIKKESEMKAKLEQIEEATNEKIKLCEIQYEERSRNVQEHWTQQQDKINQLDKEANDLKYKLSFAKEEVLLLKRDISNLKNENDVLKSEKKELSEQLDNLRDDSKNKFIDFENEINKLTLEVEKVKQDKKRYELSLTVTRDIVEVLTMRLRESDSEVELLEDKVRTLTDAKEALQDELTGHKNKLNSTLLECSEYKDALANIVKSKAVLAQEHNRIMEHNASLLASLQRAEQAARRELGTIHDELIEDVETLKNESNTQIKKLQDEVCEQRALCGGALAAARALVARADAECARTEADNLRLQQQIEDQQSLVVELSLLRQENEELSLTVAKQSSIIDQLKRGADIISAKPKSPLVARKSHKIGKENVQTIISPLRERNH